MSWREQLTRRSTVYGTGAAAAVLLVLGILVVVGLLSNRYHVKWDLTREQSQSLSAVTKALLAQVSKPLSLTAFYPEGSEREDVKNLLDHYAYGNPAISYRFVDPEREPLKAREAGYRFQGNVLLEYEGRRQMAERPDEEAVTSALRKILKPEGKKLYFLTGHGERDFNDPNPPGLQVARRALENEGYEVKPLNLMSEAAVPNDATVVIAASPQKPLMAHEVAALKAYLEQGGRVLALQAGAEKAGLRDFLTGYGVVPGEGLILDNNQVSRSLGASLDMPLAIQYGPSPITKNFQNMVTVYPLARPLTLKSDVKGVTLQPLVTSMPSSWEKRGKEWRKSGQTAFDAKLDAKGPFVLAGLAEIKLTPPPEGKGKSPGPGQPEESAAYLAAFGDVDFAANPYFNVSGNGDLFLNTVNFLAREEKQITIRRGDLRVQPLSLTTAQAWSLFLLSVVFIPLAVLGAGVAAYRKRRG